MMRFIFVVGILFFALHTKGYARSINPSDSLGNSEIVAWEKSIAGLEPKLLERALQAYRCGMKKGLFERSILTIIDYRLPSTKKRLWVLDLVTNKLLFHEWVAHGKGSGENWANRFSNRSQSYESSLGLYVTLQTYTGRHGYSLKLRGLEPGFNDQAENRSIVIHGAWYVSEAFAKKQGRLGRSWGCPALDQAVASKVIDTIKDGSALFVYYPDKKWLEQSSFLRCQ